MADIKQAAKWMQKEKKVRRKNWRGYCFMDALHWILDGDWKPVVFSPESLLADDWEIAEEVE